MSRYLRVAAAQLGPIQRADTRADVVKRLVAMLREAHASGCKLVVFPELALTTFFPRYFMERFNTAILVSPDGNIIGKYRKIHLPGHAEHLPGKPYQHLEKRYFEVGDLGFRVWRAFGGVIGMCICNDRRWPETFRVFGLQGVEIVVLGYNTPDSNIYHPQPVHQKMFHHLLTIQAGAYQNGTWVVATAKAGSEDGHGLIGGTAIVAPTGEIAAKAVTEDDEVVTYTCDLDLGKDIKENIFNFEQHRRIEHYGLITSQTGVVPPPE
jgi:predicted amidohydrolase